MFKKLSIACILIVLLGLILAATVWFFQGKTIAILQPEGIIAHQQRNLIVAAVWLAAVVILPVFAFALFVALRYRDGNTRSDYKPDWNFSKLLTGGWWLVLVIIISTMGVISWQTTHALDPYKAIVADKAPMTIQVVALQYKWLFLYPEQDIATVNFVAFPEDTPVTFELTADAPMNSFWIPQLGGQMYAMEGMVTKLHLMADKPGTYSGSSAEISGEGFAGMRFEVKTTTDDQFEDWVGETKASSRYLSSDEYTTLAKPGEAKESLRYSSYLPSLYDMIVMKFMPSGPADSDTSHTNTTDHSMHDMPGM